MITLKSLFKNTIYNLIYRLFSLLFPLISSIYVSRILMPEGVGKVAYAQNLVSYFIVFAGLGIANYGIREIGRVQKNSVEYSKVFTELFIITLISTTFCSILYYSWVLIFLPPDKEFLLYIAVGFQLVLSAFNVDWFYQGMEEYKYITNRSILIKFVALIFMFCTVKTENDIVWYALMSSVAIGGNNIINLFHLRKYITKVSFKEISLKYHIKPLLILLSTNLAVELYTKLDTTTLGILAHDENVGYYNYATKISSIVVTLAATFSTVLLPRLSYHFKNGDNEKLKEIVALIHKVLLTLSIPITIGLFFIADDVILLMFGEPFLPAAITVRILSLLVTIKSIGNLYGVQVLLTFGGEKFLFYTTIIGAISNILMNIILIPYWQENGAAIASVISELLVCIVQIVFSRQYIKVSIQPKIYLEIFVSCLFMVIVLFMISTLVSNILIRIFLNCILGCITYYILMSLLKNEVVLNINNKISSIIKKIKSKNLKEG